MRASNNDGGQRTAPVKTLQQREKELQALLGSAEGMNTLRELEAAYSAVSGKVRPAKSSVITFILVYERACGLIDS